MNKRIIGCLVVAGLTGTALAQEAGSTYPMGSNLPQRTSGEVGPKTVGQMGGSGGPTSANKGQKKSKRSKTSTSSKHRKPS